ncbi:S-layer family protein [Herbaspirillum sp. GW103]|uniref:S-layer family protein n=1 Tax=Herbaspirillum sp. GW103 TaxID=1175306 RepID=UPI001ED90B48|nr:S-layer family protein [Herbaspirillum sp. GW103]
MAATEGELVVTAAGRLENTGTIAAGRDAQIRSAGVLINQGRLGGRAGTVLEVGSLENTRTGRIDSTGHTSVQSGGSIRNAGSLLGDGGITIRAAAMENTGDVLTPGALLLRVRDTLDNSGTVEAKQSVSLKATALNNRGTFTAAGSMKLLLQQGLSNTGEIGANDTLTVNAATLENHGRLRSAESSLVLVTDGRTSNQGKLLAATRLELAAAGIDNSDGTLGGGEVVIDARNRRLNNQRGVLFARQDLKAESAELDNRAGSIAVRGKLTLSTGEVNNEGGLLQALKSLDLDTHGQALHNLHSGENQGVRAGTDLHIKAGALGNGAGVVVAGGQARLQVNSLDNNRGRILAGDDLSLTSDSLIGKGLLLSHKDLRIDVAADLEQRGETAAAGHLDLRTGGRFSNYGTLVAGAALRVTARGLQNHAGASILGGDVSLSAGAGQDFINRGLIDGVTTRIQAGTLYNLGSGRIYGDRIALAAEVLHNASQTIDGVLRAPVIAARERLDIGTGVLHNSEKALLYSAADMSIGGAIGSDHRASGRAREVNNTSATVNADGALTIAADAINNRNAHFEIADESKPGRRIINYRLVGSSDFISGEHARIVHKDNGQIIAAENWRAMGDEDNFRLLLPSAQSPFDGQMFGQWIIYDGTEQIQRTIVTRSAPGMITSGGRMNLAAGEVNNYASQFIAGGTLAGDNVNGTAIHNTGPLGRQIVTSVGTAVKTYIKSHRFKADDRRYESAPYASQTIETRFPLDVSATHEVGSTRDRTPRTPATGPAQAPQGTGKTTDLRAPAVDLSLPANALYQINQSSAAAPLVQTDPHFIGERNWLSSDVLVRAYQDRAGPAPGYQRFGDGFYEQQLIQRQIQEATGQRYLNGFSNNEAQYLALMQAGLQQAQTQRYALGIALTEAQIAQLKTDIVWLVQRKVTLADGSEQEVLVPQVYLQPSNLRVSGRQTLIAGNEVVLQSVQDVINRGGTIAARGGVTLRAETCAISAAVSMGVMSVSQPPLISSMPVASSAPMTS